MITASLRSEATPELNETAAPEVESAQLSFRREELAGLRTCPVRPGVLVFHLSAAALCPLEARLLFPLRACLPVTALLRWAEIFLRGARTVPVLRQAAVTIPAAVTLHRARFA